MMSTNINTKIYVSSFDIQNIHSQKLLGVKIGRNLNCHDYVFNQCKKTSAKISATARVFPFMLLNQKKQIMKANLMSQFGYCPLGWINNNRALNNRINSLHERALRLVYKDFNSSFQQLSEKG